MNVLSKISAFIFLLVLSFSPPARSASLTDFPTQLNYPGGIQGRLYLPPDWNSRNCALVLHFHGAGQWGSDNTSQVTTGNIDNLVQAAKDNHFVLYAPQSYNNNSWGEDWKMDQAVAMITQAIQTYHLDPNRIYVTGLSAGGGGAWRAISYYPNFFAAAVPICGTNDSAGRYAAMVGKSIWAFHGDSDTQVNVGESRYIVNQIQIADFGVATGMPPAPPTYTYGPRHNLTYTEYPGRNHDIWSDVYARADVYTWMLAISLNGSNPSAPTISGTPPAAGTVGVAYGPFTFGTTGTAPLTFSLATGSLPPGLNLNTTTGVISGTPTTVGNWTASVRVQNSVSTATTPNFTITISAAGTLPPGYTLANIGTGSGQSASYNSGTGVYTVSGAGTDIWNSADSFQYLYQTTALTGDVTVEAKLDSITNTDVNAKGGLMIRGGLASNAPFAMVCYSPGGSTSFMWRTTAGASVQYVPVGYGSNVRFKLVRSGNNFSAYVSDFNSGTGTWNAYVQIGATQAITMSPAYLGLVECSHAASSGTVTLSNLVITTPTTFSLASIGSNTNGAGSFSNGVYTVTGASIGDIWNYSDSFEYLYKPLTGDTTVLAQLGTLTNTSPYAKGGIMIRAGLAANAPFAMVCYGPNTTTSFMWRPTAGAAVQYAPVGYGSNIRFKLVRSGNNFSGYVSDFNSGTGTWNAYVQIGTTQAIPMTGQVYAGLVECSNASTTGTVTLSNVTLP